MRKLSAAIAQILNYPGLNNVSECILGMYGFGLFEASGNIAHTGVRVRTAQRTGDVSAPVLEEETSAESNSQISFNYADNSKEARFCDTPSDLP
jgi:hypothetical protein